MLRHAKGGRVLSVKDTIVSRSIRLVALLLGLAGAGAGFADVHLSAEAFAADAKGGGPNLRARSIILREGALSAVIASAVSEGDFVRPVVNIVTQGLEADATIRVQFFIGDDFHCEDELTVFGDNFVFAADCLQPFTVRGSLLDLRAVIDSDSALSETDEEDNESRRTFVVGEPTSLDVRLLSLRTSGQPRFVAASGQGCRPAGRAVLPCVWEVESCARCCRAER